MAAKTSAEPRPSRAPETYFTDLMRFDGSLLQMFARPLQVCLRLQADLLRATEPFSAEWLERRREGVDAALEALEKLTRCTDLAEAASVQRAWFDGTIKRLNSDIEAMTAHVTALSGEAVAAARSATQAPSGAISSAQPRAVEKAPQSVAAA
jgi:hypothetical protein